MSRVGKLPIVIPSGVDITIGAENNITVKGPKGTLNRQFSPLMKISMDNGQIVVERKSESKFERSLHGLSRALLSNMVQGVTNGFERKLEIIGVGYKAEMRGKTLLLNLGYSHPILVKVPDNISLNVPAPNEVIVSGIDKELVGLVAAKIRSFRKPEPYKGKGVRYAGEYVRRKAGKAAGK